MSAVTVAKILYSTSGVETWITSDGRAYFVRLEENAQTGGTVVDLDNEVNPSGGVSVKFRCHSVYMLNISFIRRIPQPTGVRGVKTRIFLRITWVRHKTNTVGRGLASITSKFLDGYRSLGSSRVMTPAVESLSITNRVEP